MSHDETSHDETSHDEAPTPRRETPSDDRTASFSAAIGELEAILQRIDGDEIDVDRLADELRRATELLELCRGKIRKAEVEVHQIVDRLDPES